MSATATPYATAMARRQPGRNVSSADAAPSPRQREAGHVRGPEDAEGRDVEAEREVHAGADEQERRHEGSEGQEREVPRVADDELAPRAGDRAASRLQLRLRRGLERLEDRARRAHLEEGEL
jgi:hypothetical protein